MNRVDPFFTLILVLLSALIVTYKAAQYDLSGLKFQMLVNEQLKHQIKVLELKQKELELTQAHPQPEQKRTLSSVAEVAEQKVELDPAVMAKSMYQDAQKKCIDPKKNVQCLEQVESVISQFPDTVWAGQSLILLTQFYIKNRKIAEAKEIVKVVQLEFQKYPQLQSQLNDIEKNRL